MEIGAIDRANLQLRIIGKGDRERLVRLPQPVLDGLRALWKTQRDPRWLFPNHSGANSANQQVLRRTFPDAARAAGITRLVPLHAPCVIMPSAGLFRVGVQMAWRSERLSEVRSHWKRHNRRLLRKVRR